jgi:hypothetical protein
MRRPQATGLPHRRSRPRPFFRTLLERRRYFSLAFRVKRDILVSNYACEEAD